MLLKNGFFGIMIDGFFTWKENSMRLLIIIPAYNEEGNILSTLKDLQMNCPDADVVVINDCSRDGTKRILQEAKESYLDLYNNLGIGGAVQTGYLYAEQNQYDIAVQFDGDGQHRADCIDKLIKPILDGKADMTIGSRFMKDSDADGFKSSAARRTGIKLLSGLIHMVTGEKVMDVTSGFRAVNRNLIEFYSQKYAQDYPEPEAIVMAINNGYKVQEVPAKMNERTSGTSSIKAFSSIYYMIKVSLAILIAGAHSRRNKRKVKEA